MEFDINSIIMTTKKLGVYAHSKISFKRREINSRVKASNHIEIYENIGVWLWKDIHILYARTQIGIR